MSQIQNTQLGVYFAGVMPSATYKNSQMQIDATSESQMFPVPGVAIVLPVDSGFINVGLGVYIPSGLGVTWNGDDFMNMTGGNSLEWKSQIGVVNFAPAVSIQLLPSLSLGATFNLSYGFLDLSRPVSDTNRQSIGQYSESSSGLGYGATIGVLFKPINMLSIGASFRTANTIAFTGTAKNGLMQSLGDADLTRDISWPMWIGGGIAFKPISLLTITADVQYTAWSNLDSIHTDYTNWEAAGVTGGEMYMLWEDKMQYRLGAEVNLFDFLALRAGYYIDPAPAPDKTANILFPSIDYQGLTFGVGLNISQLTIEGSVEYMIGSERTIATQTLDNNAGLQNNNIFSFWLGAAWNF